MKKRHVGQLLVEISDFSRKRGFTSRETAEKLNIPYDTFRKWFQKGKSKKNPSPTYIEKMESFLKAQKETDTYWKELWMKVLKWWQTQHRYSTVKELAGEIGWDVPNLRSYLLNKKIPPRLIIEKIAKTIGIEAPTLDFLPQEAQRKTEKVKHILLFLEEELRWFRDNSKEARDVFRKELDSGDIGYISSLLTMLGDENKFERWLTLTTNRFDFFKKRGGQK